MRKFRFSQVNVFATDPLGGNPVAVVHGAESLNEERMFAIARWTNLSETTFILPPTNPDADYQVRIFSPGGELPFAGHPTLGSCHAWLLAGGKPKKADAIVQQCEIGLVSIKEAGSRLEFVAPPVIRTGPLDDEMLSRIMQSLALKPADIAGHQWVDNGPGWCAIMLHCAQQVLSLRPDWATLAPLNLGVVGPQNPDHDAAIEVRAFIGQGGYEDPVTGSLNASLAQWLTNAGLVEPAYIAAQGTNLQRAGRVHLRRSGDDVWVGGDVVEVVKGDISV